MSSSRLGLRVAGSGIRRLATVSAAPGLPPPVLRADFRTEDDHLLRGLEAEADLLPLGGQDDDANGHVAVGQNDFFGRSASQDEHVSPLLWSGCTGSCHASRTSGSPRAL